MAMQLRLGPEEDRMLASLAEEDAQSKTATVSSLVRAEWKRRQNRAVTRSILDDVTASRPDLLDRLAQ